MKNAIIITTLYLLSALWLRLDPWSCIVSIGFTALIVNTFARKESK